LFGRWGGCLTDRRIECWVPERYGGVIDISETTVVEHFAEEDQELKRLSIGERLRLFAETMVTGKKKRETEARTKIKSASISEAGEMILSGKGH